LILESFEISRWLKTMRTYDEETQDEFLRRCKSCMEKKRGSLQ
jgi:hypothetical protein